MALFARALASAAGGVGWAFSRSCASVPPAERALRIGPAVFAATSAHEDVARRNLAGTRTLMKIAASVERRAKIAGGGVAPPITAPAVDMWRFQRFQMRGGGFGVL